MSLYTAKPYTETELKEVELKSRALDLSVPNENSFTYTIARLLSTLRQANERAEKAEKRAMNMATEADEALAALKLSHAEAEKAWAAAEKMNEVAITETDKSTLALRSINETLIQCSEQAESLRAENQRLQAELAEQIAGFGEERRGLHLSIKSLMAEAMRRGKALKQFVELEDEELNTRSTPYDGYSGGYTDGSRAAFRKIADMAREALSTQPANYTATHDNDSNGYCRNCGEQGTGARPCPAQPAEEKQNAKTDL